MATKYNYQNPLDLTQPDGGCCDLPSGCVKLNSFTYSSPIDSTTQGAIYGLSLDKDAEMCEQLCSKTTGFRKDICNTLPDIDTNCCGCNTNNTCPGDSQ